MAELAALNIKIRADAKDLEAELNRARQKLDQFSAAVKTSGSGATNASGAFGNLVTRLKGSTGTIQNVSFQIQDLAVQLAAGTKASVAFGQQGPQLLSAFGPVGAMLGVLVAVGLPALAIAFAAAGSEARTFQDVLDDLSGIQDNLAATTDILAMSQTELNRKFGEGADMVRQFAVAQAEAYAAQAQQRLAEHLFLIDDLVTKYGEATKSVGEFGESFDLSDAVINLQNDLTLTREEAGLLAEAFNALDEAGNFEEQQAALMLVDEAMKTLGISATEIPPLLNDALIQLREMVFAANALAAAAAAARSAAAGMNSGSEYPGLFSEDGNIMMPPDAPPEKGRGGGGGRKTNPIERELEALRQMYLTQEEIQLEAYARQQELLQQALQQRLITQQEYASLMEQVEQSHHFKMYQSANKGVSDVLGALGQLFQGSKEISAGIALANAWLSFTEVMKDPSFAGRPWARFAAAAKALAAGLNAVRNIKSAAKGGGNAGSASSASQPAQTVQPLQATLNLQGPFASAMQGALGPLLDGLNKEAGDRGYQLLVRA